MPRESVENILAAMAPAKKSETQAGQSQAVVNELNSTETIGFGIPANGEEYVAASLNILDKNQQTIANPLCYAKRITLTESDGTFIRDKFYVKVGLGGCVFDPWGTMDEGRQSRFASQHGRKAWDWCEVKQTLFTNYLKYLRTRNRTWYTHVDRELRNG
jgi:hypothetical protein